MALGGWTMLLVTVRWKVNPMEAPEIYREFIKLNDTQKASIIKKFEAEGTDEQTILGLKWLACLSSEQLQHKVLTHLYAEQARERMVA